MQRHACTTQHDRSPRQWDPDERVTLSQAARIAPGGVSPNCVWRWCRRGVLARTGERARLEHIRVGGKLFTTPRWLEEFGKRLAEADAAYFDASTEESNADPSPYPPMPKRDETTVVDFTGTTHTPDPLMLPLSLPGETTSASIANRVGELLDGQLGQFDKTWSHTR